MGRARGPARWRGDTFDTRVDLREMDAKQLAFDDACGVTPATFGFCSVPDPVRGLREALRVTRPGGRLLLLEHAIATHEVLARLMTVLDPVVHWMIGVHIARRTAANVERARWHVYRVTPLSKCDIFRRTGAHSDMDGRELTDTASVLELIQPQHASVLPPPACRCWIGGQGTSP